MLVLTACFSGNGVFASAAAAAFCLPTSQRPLCSPGCSPGKTYAHGLAWFCLVMVKSTFPLADHFILECNSS